MGAQRRKAQRAVADAQNIFLLAEHDGVVVDALPASDHLPSILVETASNIQRELYLSMLVDRAVERIVVMASAAGGMDIEEVAEKTPEQILTVAINPACGLQPYQCRKLAFGLGLSGKQIKQFGAIVSALTKMFIEKDASLVEINPLIVTGDDDLVALDGKINLEEYGVFFKGYGMPDVDIKAAFEKLDSDGDGQITTDEFTKAFDRFGNSDNPDDPSNYMFGAID